MNVFTILILKHPTEFESIMRIMGGFWMVNTLLWKIPGGFAVIDASIEPGIFCYIVVEPVLVPLTTPFIMWVDNECRGI